MLSEHNVDNNRQVSVGIPQLSGGGAEKVTLWLCRRLNRDGRLGSLITTGPIVDGDLDRIVPMAKPPRARRLIFRAMFNTRRSSSGVTFLTLGFMMLAIPIRIAKWRQRIVIRVGNTLSPELGNLSFLRELTNKATIGLALKCADVIVTQSDYMKEDLCKLFPSMRGKTITIYNPVIESTPSSPSEEISEQIHGLPGGVILCASTNKPQKALDVLIEAFAAYRRSGGKRVLVLAGVGPDDSGLNEWMRQCQVEDELVLRLGFVEYVDWLIQKSDICILPSRYEGFSNFALEAAQFGKRIILTNCPGGNSELGFRYHNIDFCEVGDVKSMAVLLAGDRRDERPGKASGFSACFHEDAIYRLYCNVLWPAR